MARKIRLTKTKIQLCRADLQKRFLELQELREQIRLAELAARQASLRSEEREAERPHAAGRSLS
jgi:hypothetical protein